jgi:CheY-like chemotaxis protein
MSHIMIADDDPMMRELLEFALHRVGHTIVGVSTALVWIKGLHDEPILATSLSRPTRFEQH